ncbi:spore wall protein 2-like [Aplysia californica]|uniref:Spore wall protein 2-like n=1 Tax=Aplysia californica TaxID=6500 RepID=A0ABM0JKA5_APLCA|nr:spore wall protein 2-like [Aplysia californica]
MAEQRTTPSLVGAEETQVEIGSVRFVPQRRRFVDGEESRRKRRRVSGEWRGEAGLGEGEEVIVVSDDEEEVGEGEEVIVVSDDEEEVGEGDEVIVVSDDEEVGEGEEVVVVSDGEEVSEAEKVVSKTEKVFKVGGKEVVVTIEMGKFAEGEEVKVDKGEVVVDVELVKGEGKVVLDLEVEVEKGTAAGRRPEVEVLEVEVLKGEEVKVEML